MIYSYRRVSTDEQHLGPQAQLDSIQRWGAPDQDFCDIGFSGAVPLGERDAGGAMLAQLKDGDTVVVAKLDRLFRSVSNAATTLDDWCRRGIKLVSVHENFDMTTAMGRFMSNVMAAFAELERDMIKQRTRAALNVKKARGEHVGGIPYGYSRLGGHLMENSGEKGVLDIIKGCVAAGMCSRDIAKKLNRMGHVARNGGNWHHGTIIKIIKHNVQI